MNRRISASVTRPADTTAYTSGDVVCNSTTAPTIITFNRASHQSAGSGVLKHAKVISSAYVATAPVLELWLFDTAVTMDNDNAAFTPTDAELATLVTVVSFPAASYKIGDATAGVGGNHVCEATLDVPFTTVGANVNALYGVLVARNAYVPISGEIFTLQLVIED